MEQTIFNEVSNSYAPDKLLSQLKTPLDWALFYASKGWAVFPCNMEKKPMTIHGFYDATTDPKKITEFFTKYPRANIGIATGKVSGFFLLDIDIKKGQIGDQSLTKLEAEHGKLPRTISAISWSGGEHYLLKCPESGMPTSPSARMRPGIEIKGDGGYVIVEPSKYKGEYGEGEYHWKTDAHPANTELADAPEWLLKITAEKQSSPGFSDNNTKIPVSQRNVSLTSYAGGFRRAGLDEAQIRALLEDINAKRCEPPLSTQEVAGIAKSISRYAPDDNKEGDRLNDDIFTEMLLSDDEITALEARIKAISTDTALVKIPALLDPILKEIAGFNSAQGDALLKHTIKDHFGYTGAELKSYEKLLTGYRDEPTGRKNITQGEVLTRICEDNISTYFTDKQGEPFVVLPVDGHLETCSAGSTRLRNWMAELYREKNQHPPNSDALKQAQIQIEVRCSKSPQIELFNRVGWYEGAIYYDLTTPDWRGVKITKKGWEITALPPVFRRYKHQIRQVIPTTGGDPNSLLKFCNIRVDDYCLFMNTIATLFIPDFPHVIPYLDGLQGSGKSFDTRNIKSLVDPSAVLLMAAPKDIEHVQMIAEKHWVSAFDNISNIQPWFSDFLCRAVTGEGDMKRSLYTDDDEFIRAYRRCIVINGIGTYAERPDLLDRSIIFDIPELCTKRSEDDIKAEWNQMLPGIIGGFFTAISKGMGTVDKIKGHEVFRMSDFARWGAALAEPLGYLQDEFFKKYQESVNRKWEDAADVNTLNGKIVELMQPIEEWKGTFSDLLETINPKKDRDKNLPGSARKLSSALKRIGPLLHTSGIKVLYPATREPGTGRKNIIIHKIDGTQWV